MSDVTRGYVGRSQKLIPREESLGRSRPACGHILEAKQGIGAHEPDYIVLKSVRPVESGVITSSAPGWPLRNGSLSCVSLSHDNRARSPAISASPTLIFLFLFLAPIWICALLVYPRLFRFPTSPPCLSQILVENSSANLILHESMEYEYCRASTS